MPALKRVLRLAGLVGVGALLLLSSTVLLPLYALGPGPAREVEALIRVSGHPEYPSGGRFVMTSVSFQQVTAVGALLAWLDPNRAVVPRRDLFAGGETPGQEHRRSISQMDQSKLDATSVVLHDLTGYPADHGPGALVESVVPGCAADGALFPGDLIQSIDGDAISRQSEAMRAIGRVPSGSTATFVVTAGGERQTVRLVRRPCGGRKKALVGVSLIASFPFDVEIESGDVGGPSAGLMWGLGLYDLLTPGDLTGGRTIAGTGQIDLEGKVYPIGGIEEKVVAAERAGAKEFLVPEGNLKAAKAVGGDGMKLVPVSSFRDALDYLQGRG